MRTKTDLRHELERIDRRGYPAYKDLRGRYDLGTFELEIAHVQGDPFAAPSSLSVFVPHQTAGFPRELYSGERRRTAFEDALTRSFGAALRRWSFKAGGSGKSGLMETGKPGPEVLQRSSVEVWSDGILARFYAGFPAHGRTVDASALARMLLDFLPRAVDEGLTAAGGHLAACQTAVDLADDQGFIRNELERLGLVAFVADGSVLPRSSGASCRPMKGAVPFVAPDSMAVELDLPHRGFVRGMGVARGVTVVVGGGYHGKTTLLEAIQAGVYDHVAGNGRELVVTDATAVKVRAEDGRPVWGTDVSAFMGDLPGGRDARHFTSSDASGSTSQAASLVEAVQAGARTILVDEDTAATNFMSRDTLMRLLVEDAGEPITPLAERVRGLFEGAGVSTMVVAGSSGAFLHEADAVVRMEGFRAHDVSDRVRAMCAEHPESAPRRLEGFPDPEAGGTLDVLNTPGTRDGGRRGRVGRHDGRPPKVRASGLDSVQAGGVGCDLRLVEGLVDAGQVRALGQMLRRALEHGLLDGKPAPVIARELYDEVLDRGFGCLGDSCDLALPRFQEVCACLNRLRPAREPEDD